MVVRLNNLTQNMDAGTMETDKYSSVLVWFQIDQCTKNMVQHELCSMFWDLSSHPSGLIWKQLWLGIMLLAFGENW